MPPLRCSAKALLGAAALAFQPCEGQSTGPGPGGGEDGGAPSQDNGSGGASGVDGGVSGYTSIFQDERGADTQEDESGAGPGVWTDGAEGSGFAGLGPCVVGFGGEALQFGTFTVLVTAGRCRSSFRAMSAEDLGLSDALGSAYTPPGGAGVVCRTEFAISAGPEYLDGQTAMAATSPDGRAYAGKVVQGKCHFGVAPNAASVAGTGAGQEVFTRDYFVLLPDGFSECDVSWVQAQQATAAHLTWWPEESSAASPVFADQYVICLAEYEGEMHPGYARGGQLNAACQTWCGTSAATTLNCDAAVCRACAPCGGGEGGTPGRATADAPSSYKGCALAVSLAATIAVAMARV